MRRKGAPEDAYGLALKALGRKERTEHQLAEWLRARGVEEAELAEVMVRLYEAELLDDQAYAVRYAADKRELRGWGPDRIREALRQRGVPETFIEQAIGCEDEGEQLERAVGLLAERDLDCDSDAGRGKALRLLVRRGFPLEVGYAAVRSRESRAA
jgi:regulatory protein